MTGWSGHPVAAVLLSVAFVLLRRAMEPLLPGQASLLARIERLPRKGKDDQASAAPLRILVIEDNHAAARASREDQTLEGVHLIALSGYADSASRKRCADAGFATHLAKPPGIGALAQVLGAVVARGSKAAVGGRGRPLA